MKISLIHLSVLILGIMTLGCQENEKENSMVGAVVELHLLMSIKDPLGNDLLDPDRPGSLSSFKVYYLKDGEKVLHNRPMADAPGAYVIEKWSIDNVYRLKVFLDWPGNAEGGDSRTEHTTTYLEYEDGTTDTIQAVLTVKPGYTVVEKAWYNDTLAWDRSRDNGGIRTFELLKP